MISVLIAEDEPAAARYLRSLVELLGPEFEVDTAANGEEALARVRVSAPDLVLTDVQMPLLDGIGLLAALRRDFPDLPTVIVSGYQEFEYARQALALGVADYLLKPVSPSALHRLLTDLAQKIRSRRTSDSIRTIHAALGGGAGAPARCLAALVRWGGPVARGSGRPASGGSMPEEGLWIIPGRDANEFLVIADADRLGRDVFEERVRRLERPGRTLTATLAFVERPVASDALAASAEQLAQAVDRLLTLGRTRSHWGPVEEAPPPTLDPVWLQKVRLALGEAAFHRLEALVRSLAADWAKAPLPARHAALLLRQVLLLVQTEAPGRGLNDWEFLLEDGLQRLDSFEQLADLAWNLFNGVAGLGSVSGADAPETHQRIRRFVQAHYSEPLSIPLVCDRFQLSQTYLSKLFRKYEGCTFHEYLTQLRLDAAETLLNDSPGLPLKTVAAAVGYQDPFHFSRAFKAAKGRPPSRRAENSGS